jgi:hypothetical protein
MDRRSFLKLLGSMSFFGLAPVRGLLSSAGDEEQSIEDSFTPEQLDAYQKIKFFEAQLEQQGGSRQFYLNNELRHYWGAFSESKSLSYANAILEYHIMDPYILNTLSDWYYTTEEGPIRPDLALASLQRRADEYPQYHYLKAACLFRAGEISADLDDGVSARGFYQQVITEGENFIGQASQLLIYQYLAQVKMMDRV